MRIGKLEINLRELQNFIVEAKQKGYASGGKKKKEADGSKTFIFQKGNLHYTDNYSGSYQAPGDEIVRWQREDGQRIWHMAYSGGMPPKFWGQKKLKDETFKFLKEVLMQVSFDYPFRGPPRYENNDFLYTMEVKGDIQRFFGTEWITNKGLNRNTFSQDFIGGLIIPK